MRRYFNKAVAAIIATAMIMTSAGSVYADDVVSSSQDSDSVVSEIDYVDQNISDEADDTEAEEIVSEDEVQEASTISDSTLSEGTEEVTPAANATSGTCGENLSWTYDEGTGTLTISGTGAMQDYADYSSEYSPWYSFKQSISNVIVANGVTSIGDYAFFDCTSLSSVTLPSSLNDMGECSFSGCNNLTTLELPEGMTEIGNSTFSRCSSLTAINIPDSVISIGYYAFLGCSSLVNIELPEGITELYGTFYNCSSLKTINLPGSILSIGYNTFNGCSRLRNISIPESVTSIGSSVFSSCDSLEDVYYAGSEEQWNAIEISKFGNDSLSAANIHYNATPVAKPQITSQPVNAIAALKAKATFSVSAENAASYQWQYSKNGGETWSNLKDSSTTSSYIAGATTDNLTILTTATRCSYIYRCQITGTDGEVINSDSVSLIKDTALYITTQPKDTVGTLMKKTTFKVTAVNAVSYLWQYSKNDGSTWNTLKDSANTSTYLGGSTTNAVTMLMNASRGSFIYRCQITGEDGNVAYTDSVKVLIFAITTQPESVQAKSGDTVTFRLSADYAKSYQWYYQKAGSTSWYKLTDNTKASMLVSGSTSDSLTVKMTKTRMTYRYRCKVIGQNGTSKYSDAVEILS